MQKLENANSDRDCFITLKRWLENRNQNKYFSDYFHQYGYRTVAIYGAGDLGRLLYEEIKETDIVVKYFVDRNAEGLHQIEGIPVYTISEAVHEEETDVLVITPVGNYDEICKVLVKQIPWVRLLSLREAVYEF